MGFTYLILKQFEKEPILDYFWYN